MVCHRLRPQDFIEVLRGNKTSKNIWRYCNHIGNEGAKAWCLARGSVATKRNQGFVSVVRETCETLVLLDGCSGVRPLDLSKRVTEMGWKQDESGTGEIVLIPVKLEKESNTSVKQYLVLAQIHANSP